MKKHLLSMLVAMVAATMSLNAQTIVIDDGFENGIQDSVWTQEYVIGHTPWAVESMSDSLAYPSTVKQGIKRAYLRNMTGETQGYVTRLVSKVMNLSPNRIYQPFLSFWYANPKWTSDRDTLRVYYRTGKNARWKLLSEYSKGAANWQKVNIELPEVNETYQIAFEGTDNLGRGIVLDSVKVRSAPECTVPHDIIANNKGSNKVNIAWSASWDANYFELVVAKDTIDPDTVETVNPERVAYHGMVSGLQQNYDLTLEGGEFYYVYIRSICEQETSLWSSMENGPYGFRVRDTKQIPYSYGFDDLAGTEDVTRNPQWTWMNNTGKNNPYVNTKTTSQSERAKYSYNKTPAVIFSGANVPTTVIPADKFVYLATPALSDSMKNDFSLNQCQVRFWSSVYIYTGRTYARSIVVGVMTDPEDITTFVPVDTVSVWGNQTFQENIVDLGSYTGRGAYVAFMSDFDRQNLYYIDDVTIEYRPAVKKVTKISVNPRDTYADITWEGNASSYNVLVTNAEVDPANPSAEAVVVQTTVNTNSYHCTGLEADHSWNRPYYVYVQAVGSEWSYRYPFVTIAAKRAIPYSFDFENASGRYRINTSSQTYYPTNIGIFGNDPKYPALDNRNPMLGSNSLLLNKTAGADAWITLPMVDNLDSVQVKFYLSGSTAYQQSHAEVGVMTNPMDINTFHKVADFTLNTTGYTMCYANFENYNGPDGVIAIVWGDFIGMGKNTINYIDELKVEELSECVPPANVQLEIASDSITASWNASSSDMWEVVISRTALSTAQKALPFSEIKAMGSVTVADTVYWYDHTTAPYFGFGGLRSQTNYYFYVRTVCYGDAAWWVEQSFTTPCPDNSIPYKEDFESCTQTSSNAAPQLPCWEMVDYMSTTYPYIYAANGGKTLELWSTGSSHRNVVILPPVEGDLSDLMLSFETRSWTASSKSVLYVGTMSDITDQSTFVPFDTIFNDQSDFQKVTLILRDYNLVHNKLAFSSGLGNLMMASDVLIDNVELKDANCISAYDLQQVDGLPYSAQFTWKGVTTAADEWELKVLNTKVSVDKVASDNYDPISMAIVNDTVVIGKQFAVSGLQPNTPYYVYIRNFCGDSVWVMHEIRTACEFIDPTKPNKETFESYMSGTSYSSYYQPDCWYSGNGYPNATDTYLPYIYDWSTYASSGTNTFRMYGYSYYDYTPAYVVSPAIDCTSMADIAVTFNMYASTSYYWICGVMSNPHDLSTFVMIDSVKGMGESIQYTYDLSEYADSIPATARYFAWRTPYDLTSYAYLDDVSFSSLSCPLTKPSYSELTPSTVRISSGLRVDNDWRLVVTTAPINTDSLLSPTYVIPASILAFDGIVSSRSKVVSNLMDQTTYYVATAAICDSIVSQWRTLSFTTPCMPVKLDEMGVITFSAAEGFTTGTSGTMPCWTKGSKTRNATASYIPYINNTSTYQHNGKNYLQLYDYVSGTSSNYVGAYAIMPELFVDSINKYQVNFWARGNTSSSYNSQVIVGVITDPSDLNTFVVVDTLNLSKTAYEPFSVGFENYMGDYLGDMGKNIMFLSEFGVTNYAYISEISVELIPRCRPVSSFSVDSIGEDAVIVSWKGYQDTYRLLVSDRLVEDKDKPTYEYLIDSVVTGSTVRLANLNAATNYYIYAQGICGGGDSTAISMTYALARTLCPTTKGVPVPYREDFESYEAGTYETELGCWQLRDYSGSGYPKLLNLTTGAKSGNQLELWTTSSHNCVAMMPTVDGSLDDCLLSFDTRSWSTSATSTLYVGTMADIDDPTTFVPFDTISNADGETFNHVELTLSEYNLVYDNLAFSSGLNSASSDVMIDNIALTMISTCHAPKLTAGEVTATSIEVLITPAKPENDSWELVIVSDSVLATITDLEYYLNKVAERVPTTELSVLFSKLASATRYNVFARTNCGGLEGNSPWSREPLRVKTRYYFGEGYSFGFEKEEGWTRSQYSPSDLYYLHPALITGRDTIGNPSTSYNYYPYSIENTTTNIYAHTDEGALNMMSSGNFYGGYIIFPAVGLPSDRSFEFKVRPGYIDEATQKPTNSYDGILEIGTVDNNKDFDTYQPLASIHLDKLNPADKPTVANHNLFQYYTLDIDSNTIAHKQIVLHLSKQPGLSSSLYIDDVILGAPKGYSLVAIDKIVADGTSASIEWVKIGGPWNLYIYAKDAAGQDSLVVQLDELVNNSYVVTDLQPRTDYTAVLESASVPAGSQYVTSASMAFRTVCPALAPDENGEFVWNFDDANEWEPNDVLQGLASDTAYFKPACFNVGITYATPVNGYQWLIQQPGYNYFGSLDAYSNRHFELGRNNTGSLRINTTDAYFNSYIVLPELTCDFDSMMLEFYGRCFVNYDEASTQEVMRGKIVGAQYLSSPYSQSIVVGTLVDPMDLNTLQILDTLNYKHTDLTANDNVNNDTTGLRYWECMRTPLKAAKGKYVVLFQPAQGLFFIDDLSVKAVGNTLFAPTGLQTSNIAPTTAHLSWMVHHPELQSVVVLLNATGETELQRDTVTGTTYEMTGLNSGMGYQWYVYQIDGNRTSPESRPVLFATECVAVASDYACGFELADGWRAISGHEKYTQTLCWTYGDAIQGEWVNATYDPFNQPNNENYLYSHTDSFAVSLRGSYSSYSAAYQPYIAMPAIDVTAYDTLMVSFWMRPAYIRAATKKVATAYTGSSYSKSVIVGTMTDPTDASTFVAIDTITYEGALSNGDQATEGNHYLYQQNRVALAGAQGAYVAFMTSFYEKGGDTRKNNDYIWLDDIAFVRKRDCADPANLNEQVIGGDFATLSWESADPNALYMLQVSTDKYFADEEAFVFNSIVDTNAYTVTGLEMLTDYAWRVQTLCTGSAGESWFSKTREFKTARSPYFLEQFNTAVNAEWMFSMTHADDVLDKSKALTAGNNSWGFMRLNTGDGLEGSHYVAQGYSTDYHWMVTPGFYLPENDSTHFSMDLALTACNTAHTSTPNAVSESDMKNDYYFMIVVSDDNGASWKKQNILAKWQNTNPEGQQLRDIPADGMKVRYSLAPYAGKHIRIGFYREAKSTVTTGIAIHLDNVRLGYFDKTADYATACQYEDIDIGNIHISGEDTEPGIHQYPVCFYASDEDAKAGARDSVYAVEVEVFATPETEYSDTICQGETYTNPDFYGKDRTGTYRRKLKTQEHGCDSIVTLYLYVTPTAYAPDVIDTLCQGETLTWNGRVYNRAGIYRDTLVSALGCDSVETLVLAYYQQEDTISVGETIKQDELPYSYTNPEYPYAAGQAPIYYGVGTPVGKYMATAYVYGANGCIRVLKHTLFIQKSQGIDDIFDESGSGARKVIYRDQLYIILNDEWYNAEGKHVADPRK